MFKSWYKAVSFTWPSRTLPSSSGSESDGRSSTERSMCARLHRSSTQRPLSGSHFLPCMEQTMAFGVVMSPHTVWLVPAMQLPVTIVAPAQAPRHIPQVAPGRPQPRAPTKGPRMSAATPAAKPPMAIPSPEKTPSTASRGRAESMSSSWAFFFALSSFAALLLTMLLPGGGSTCRFVSFTDNLAPPSDTWTHQRCGVSPALASSRTRAVLPLKGAPAVLVRPEILTLAPSVTGALASSRATSSTFASSSLSKMPR
mmetsp:Transcript_35213/g.76914  ORF Transcript_35213/g.76914 Transcript_35213/m.76914 type:complete len:256 (+) Transcript_35213:1122-1889(+)